MSDFIPQNPLEIALQAALAPGGQFAEFLKVFVKSETYLPSAKYTGVDTTNFHPILFDKGGEPHMLAFTARDRTSAVAHVGPFISDIPVHQLLRNMPAGTGLIVNPDLSASFSLSAAGLQRLAQDVSRSAT